MSAPPFFRGSATASSSPSVSSLSVTYNVQQAGSLLFAFAANNFAFSVSDTMGNTWNLLFPTSSPGSSYTSLWVTKPIATGSTTVTFLYTSSQTFAAMFVSEYSSSESGAPIIDFFSEMSYPVNAGTASYSQTMTTRAQNELLVIFGNIYGANVGYNSSSGDTMRIQNFSNGVFLADRSVGAPGAYAENGSSSSANFGTLIIYLSLMNPSGLGPPVIISSRPQYGAVKRMDTSTLV